MSGHAYGGYDPYGVAAGIPTSSVQSSPYLAWDPLSGSYVSYLIVDPGSGDMAATGPDANSSYSQSPWLPHPPPPGVEASVVGAKRSIGAVYHQNVLGSHNSIAESTALFSTNHLAKHPKLDSASNLPIYPQRPGEKDCAFYMLTRTCKFGESCKFDHPVWVPEGGIPDWKEVPLVPSEMLPERPGAPDCPYFLKTEKCKFGLRCKFNHPKDNLENQCVNSADGSSKLADTSEYPERPSEPACAFYIRTGKCKYGTTCRFHHPKDHQVAVAEIEKGQIEPDSASVEKTVINVIPASMHNSKGLPMRPGEADCSFYLKTGSCKYGVICRYNHPDIKDIYPPAASLPQLLFCSVTGGALNVAGASMPHMDASPWSIQPAMGLTGAAGYPQRPGQPECDHYMKTGLCKFGPLCRFHHPVDRISSSAKAGQNDVTLTLAGFPRREGGPTCAFYMKTGMCKYGSSCVYDHPPPGEAVAKAVATMQDPEDEGNVSKDATSDKDE